MKSSRRFLRRPRHWMALSVYESIRATVGARRPEAGGLLGGDARRGVVTHYYFDAGAATSRATYSPDSETVNRILTEWNAAGIRLTGMVHSHPRGSHEPSAGDARYAARILAANADLPFLLTPIVQSGCDQEDFAMNLFVARRSGDAATFERAQLLLFEDDATAPTSTTAPDDSPTVHDKPSADDLRSKSGQLARSILQELPFYGCWTSDGLREDLSASIFARVAMAYDLAHLRRCRVLCVGLGGAGLFTEQLARAGVGEFVLVDPDSYSHTNLATQHCYIRELARRKVDCVTERIRDINPSASVVARPSRLDDLDDAELVRLLCDPWPSAGSATPTSPPMASLLCACTDDFGAQARLNRVALKLGVALLASQVYERGLAAELVWVHPQVSRACARCILSSRYAAHARGFVRPASSEGASIHSTVRLNAAETYLALALLHHGTSHPRWGSFLARLGDRQLVQLRCDPDAEAALGLTNFSEAFRNADARQVFSDEAIWRPQHPEHPSTGYARPCPDCGGTGDLRACIGQTADTRIFNPDA